MINRTSAVCLVLFLVTISPIALASDLTAPVFVSIAADTELAAAGDMIRVTVIATDDTAVSLVTADSIPLQQVAGAWQGYVPANDQAGPHNIVVVATDAAGNISTNTSSRYTTVSVVGVGNANAATETALALASRMLFKVWGRATFVDADYFSVDDGGGYPVYVEMPGHIVRTGDYVSARGTLQRTASGVLVKASEYDIINYAPGDSITGPDQLVGNHLFLPCAATLGRFAPTDSPVTVTLSSLDPGRLLLATSADPSPRESVSVTTSAYCYYTIFGLADSGTARVAVVSSDGQRGLLKVRLAPTGFVFYSAYGYPFDDTGSMDINRYGGNGPIYIQCSVLDPVSLRAVSSGCLGYGLPDVSVAFNNSNPSVTTVTPNPLVLKGYVDPHIVQYYSSTIQPNDFGSTILTLVTPPGFTTPSEKQQVTINMVQPKLTRPSVGVGRDLQVKSYVYFEKGATTQTDVTLAVGDESIATLTTDPNAEGTGSITLNSAVTGASYYVQGRSLGTTTLTISSPGYQSATGTIFVNPSGFLLGSSSITTNCYASNTSIAVKSAMLVPATLKCSQYQNLRGGLSVSIPVSTSDATVGVLTPSPAVISANAAQAYTAFHPAGSGACIMSLGTPDGFQTPSEKQQLTATVNIPKIIMRSSSNVGRDLQTSWSFNLESAPPTPVDISVSVDDGSVAVLSLTATAVGGTNLVLGGVASTGQKTFYVQGLAVGETDVRISAPGYSDLVTHLQVCPAAFVFSTGSVSTLSMSADSPLLIKSGFADPRYGSNYVVYQPLRAGSAPVDVGMECSDTSIGTVTVSPLTFSAGSGSASSAFHPLAAGNCTLSLIQPDGFQVWAGGFGSIPVVVRKPSILLAGGCHTYTGVDLQTRHIRNLEKAPPSPVDVTVSVGDSSIATVSADMFAAGTDTAVIRVSSTSEFYYYLQGRKQGTTTLTVSASGYADSVINSVEVKPSGFTFGVTVPIAVRLSDSSRIIGVHSGTGYWSDEMPIRGGLGNVYVPVYCTDTSVGTVSGSPVMFYQYLRDSQISFIPKALGTCEVWLAPPTGWSTFPGYDRLQITVTP